MDNKEIIELLTSKDDKKSYQAFKELAYEFSKDEKYFAFIEKLFDLLKSNKSYEAVRAFKLICVLARWDSNNFINCNIDKLLKVLITDKPTALRQMITSLHELLVFKMELTDIVIKALRNIDIYKYKDSMSPLIKKDIDELIKQFLEV